MAVADGFRQLARRTGGVLEGGQIIGRGGRVVGRRVFGERGHEIAVAHNRSLLTKVSGGLPFLLVGHKNCGLAIIDAQAHAIRAEQGEQGHGNGTMLDGTKDRCIKGE